MDPAISLNETNYPALEEGNKLDIWIRKENGEIEWGKVWPYYEGVLADPGVITPETNSEVAFPDFFKPETSQWWTKEIQDFYDNELKFDGLWIDMNVPSSFTWIYDEPCEVYINLF